ncbi:MAG: hypothetical protein COW58_02355 [Thalassolituus sp. CG17_big_fil_post_rev_8_21_14_2_50_53_8]|nr:MAG: hypothetical protein COW58_02355 [Thalassolituus sp. CG17_big_fil_post_rev_8_21_14_2_50_53_8]
MDKDTLNLIIGGVVILLIIITAIAQQAKLDDPADLTVIFTHQLADLVRLAGSSPCVLAIYRQSGNLYSDPVTQPDAMAAVKAALKTMNRAKIDSLQILTNTESRLEVRRAFKNYRGKDGRKVGGFVIERVSA